MSVLVLGLGNLLLADEGVGVHAARELLARGAAEGVTVVDAGTAILDAVEAIVGADKVIVVDAMKGGGPPGTVYRVPLEDCAPRGPIGSVHGFDLAGVLFLCGRDKPPQVVVIGVEPDIIHWSTELSSSVAEALPDVIDSVRRELPD